MIVLDVAGWIVNLLALGSAVLVWVISFCLMAVVLSLMFEAIKRYINLIWGEENEKHDF